MILIFDLLGRFLLFIRFEITKLSKCFMILLKKNRKLNKIALNYHKNWHSDSSYLIVYFEFENAVYFKVGKTKSFDFSVPLIFNLQSLQTNYIELEIYGLLQKEIVYIELNKEIQLNMNSFKTKFENLSPIEIPHLKTNEFYLPARKPKIGMKNITMESQNLSIKSKEFQLYEYI